jgi:hypothetical protein
VPNKASKKKAVLREATFLDIRNAAALFEKQVLSEADTLGEKVEWPNLQERCRERIANAIASPDAILLVGDKSGRIVSVFGAEIGNPYPYDDEPCCIIFAAYQNKQHVNILKALHKLEEWGASRGCNTAIVETPAKNNTVRGVIEKSRKTEPYMICYKYDIISKEARDDN